MLNLIKQTLTYKLTAHFLKEVEGWFDTIGYIGGNLWNALIFIFKGCVNFKNTTEQSSKFGIDSLLMTLAMVGITGMIVSLQLSYEMVKQGAGDFVGMLVTVMIIRELGPVMSAFAVTSMVGSSMAAELGTMKVTEQIDAMNVLGVDPIYYLLVPRVIAGFLIMPFVVILSNTVGIIGGMITSNLTSGVSLLNYVESIWRGLSVRDISSSIVKASVFGGLIALISSSIGFKTQGGAREVGQATTKAVVWSFMAIVISDYIISLLFFN